jgi:PAS domain S-box-containing protein
MKVCSVREPMTVYELNKTGIWGEVVRQRRPIKVNDFTAPNPLKKGTPEGHAPMKNFMSIPVFHNQEIVAVVGMANKKYDYDDNDILQLELLMENVWKIVMVKRTEDKLLNEEKKFKMYFDKSPEGIFVIDDQGNILDLNPRVEEMTGYAKNELIGQSFTKFIFQESLDDAQSAFKNLLSSGFTQGTYVFITKDGRRSNANVKVNRLEDGTLLGFIEDINEELKAIEDLKNSNKELQRINALTVNRELKMVQLKTKLQELGVDPNSI